MLQPISLSLLSNAAFIEHFDLLHKTIVTNLPAPLPEPLQVALGATTDGVDRARALHKLDAFTAETEAARAADAERDRWTGVLSRLWSVLADFTPGPLQEAGAALERNFRKYGTVIEVTKQDGRAETADLKRILDSQRDDRDLAAALQAVSFAQPVLDAVANANEKYTDAMTGRLQKQADGGAAPGALKDLRDALRIPYQDLLETLWAFYLSSGKAEPWAGTVRLIEALLNETRGRLAVKEGRAETARQPAAPAPAPGA